MSLRKRLNSAFAFALALMCLLPLLTLTASASGSLPLADYSGPKTVRVGYPIQDKLTGKDQNGNYTGYNVDYLREIEKYTHWNIEYVEVEGDINTQLMTLSDMLDRGEIDMLGTMLVNDYLRELYLYPSYSYGSTYTALVVAEESNYWRSYSFSDWNGIRVGTYPGLERRMEYLAQFAKYSGFSYETVEYETLEQVLDAVYSGEVDACLQADINIEPGLRALARFNPVPYYFAIAKGREDLLYELNNAMYNLMEAYPSLQAELYSRYFTHRGSFNLSESDRSYTESLEPLRVLYYLGNIPIQGERDGEPVGVAASFINKLAEATGLKTVPVFAASYAEGMQLVMDGEVDLIAAMPSTGRISSEFRVRLSSPYFESSSVVAAWDGADPSEIPSYISSNVESALNGINRRQQTSVSVDAYCAEYYMRKLGVYDNLHVGWANRELMLYSVGLMPNLDDRLYNIISSFANSLTESEKQGMLYTASQIPLRYTVAETVELYRWQTLTGIFAIGVVILILYFIRRESKAREISREIEQLHQFSRMIDECVIRYDVRLDRLIMQNNKVVFQDTEVLQPFLKAGVRPIARTVNEERTVQLLRQMLTEHITESELALDIDGKPSWYRFEIGYTNTEYAMGRINNIDDEIEEREALERRASQDTLTGLLNRAAIQENIEDYLSHSSGGVFLLMDLDNFKRVNDTLGHVVGDKVLRDFSEELNHCFRADDWKARLGGDEFVVFLPSAMPAPQLEAKLSHFMETLSEKVFAAYRDCCLTVSIGAAYAAPGLGSFEALYREADTAMYAAKASGKNRCTISGGEYRVKKSE